MSWDEWLAIVVAWICSMKWAYSLGQKQSILLAAQLLEHSRWNIGPSLAKRIRQEYDKRLRTEPWRLFRNRWPTE